jgi:hypothetical protein
MVLLLGQNSSVGIATGYGLDGRGTTSITGRGKRLFSNPQSPDQLRGAPTSIYNGYQGALSPGVKRSGREADNSSPSAKVKNSGIITQWRRA